MLYRLRISNFPDTSCQIAIYFTGVENEQLIIACSPQVKHVIFPNTSSDNRTFTVCFESTIFTRRVGKKYFILLLQFKNFLKLQDMENLQFHNIFEKNCETN